MVRQEITQHGVTGRHPQHAAGAVVRQRAVEGVLHAAHNHIGTVEKMPPGVGEVHALGRAHEQLHAEHGFQLLDRRGHRRLGNIQVNRRLGNLADLGGGDEVANLAQG